MWCRRKFATIHRNLKALLCEFGTDHYASKVCTSNQISC